MNALNSETNTPAAPEPEQHHHQEQHCSYPGKKCTSERARKPNGSLHKLCELHRRRANLNQKRLQQKRRLLRDKLFKRAANSGDDDLVELIEASSSAVRKPSPTPSCSSTRRASSSPVSMDATVDFAATSMASSSSSSSQLSYAAQLDYLFADPLLQPDASMLTNEDVFMLQDVLFDDASYWYPQTTSSSNSNPQASWFLQV